MQRGHVGGPIAEAKAEDGSQQADRGRCYLRALRARAWRPPWSSSDYRDKVLGAKTGRFHASQLGFDAMADQDHVAILRQGADAWNAWRAKETSIERPDLREANLLRANLRRANLRGANLMEANLKEANLMEANLSGANLMEANLKEANLSGANLPRADLSEADLSGANLGGAYFGGTYFIGALLRGANLVKADLSRATLSLFERIGRRSYRSEWESFYGARADLSRADLSGANLSGANLSRADLRGANLSGANLRGTNLSETDLRGTNLSETDLSRADLSKMDLSGANLSGANLRGANLIEANIRGTNLRGTNLSETDLSRADLGKMDLSGANLDWANLIGANLSGADLSGAHLCNADMKQANLVEADLKDADLTGCRIYGISAWGLKLSERTEQRDLVITTREEPEITVDNIEVAQFIYLLIHNEKIRSVIDTITSKAVLILGRFTTERKQVLDALRRELRTRNYLPVVFDFEKSVSQTTDETITLLARMARFVVADISDAKSVLQELRGIVPDLPSAAVQPLILASQEEPGMFDFFRRYPWVLATHRYNTLEQLIADIGERVIRPAEEKVLELRGPQPG